MFSNLDITDSKFQIYIKNHKQCGFPRIIDLRHRFRRNPFQAHPVVIWLADSRIHRRVYFSIGGNRKVSDSSWRRVCQRLWRFRPILIQWKIRIERFQIWVRVRSIRSIHRCLSFVVQTHRINISLFGGYQMLSKKKTYIFQFPWVIHMTKPGICMKRHWNSMISKISLSLLSEFESNYRIGSSMT